MIEILQPIVGSLCSRESLACIWDALVSMPDRLCIREREFSSGETVGFGYGGSFVGVGG